MKNVFTGFLVTAAALLAGCPQPKSQEHASALQGLLGNTLVAGKSTAFRLFMDSSKSAAATRIDVVIVRPDGSTLTRSWPQSSFTVIPTSSQGPSLVTVVPGKDLPWIGSYNFSAKVLDGAGTLLTSYSIDSIQLLPTKDIIAAIDRVNANDVNPGSAAEIQAARDAMARLSAIWPIRDGVDTPDGDLNAGLRIVINNSPQPYGCSGNPKISDCQQCPFYAGWQNRPAGKDSMNLGIGFRFQDRGEAVGGIAPNFCPNQSVGWASIVMSGAIAPGFGQESGHVFGAEPSNDPHFDTTVQKGHSKDNTIVATASELGFDIQLNQPFPVPTFDVMHQVVCGCANSAVTYNTWDWEYLRSQFAKFNSTGPTPAAHFMSSVAPAIAGAGQSIYFFATRSDGRIYYNQAVLGQAGAGWREVDGDARTAAPPAAGSVGTHIFVAIRSATGDLLLNQADEGHAFGQWFPMNFKSDAAPAVVGVKDTVYFFAKQLDGRIFFTTAKVGQAGGSWMEVQGDGRSASAPAAGAVGDRVFIAVRGTNGSLFLNQTTLGQPFGQWFPLNFTSDVSPAVAGVGDEIYFVAKNPDGRVFFNRAQVGQAGSGWAEMQGNGQSSSAPAAGAVGTHIFVAIRNGDGWVATNQADLAQPFGHWFD